MEYSPKKMSNLLFDNKFGFKKKFGQNFIIDENIINSIVNKCEIDNDTLVIEIGPGAGSLTYKLGLVAKNVLCYEIDTSLKEILSSNLSDLNNVEIIYGDFLEADVLNDIKKFDFNKIYIIANLPYYITTPILVKIVEENIPVDKLAVMVQKEVGNRLKASPGCKDYSSLSVFFNYYFKVSKLLDVSRNVFMPVPNVDSIVVLFEARECEFLKDRDLFFKLVRDSFVYKRKTLGNNLKTYDQNIVLSVLKKYGFDLSVRAEHLSIEIFIDIANNL